MISIFLQQFDAILEKVTSDLGTPRPSHIFQVTAAAKSVSEERFQRHAADRTTLFAYHGSKLDSFHSIMNYGLQQHLCKVSLEFSVVAIQSIEYY